MRWEHYSFRDHEYGRPYVVIGTKFFARLITEIVALSNEFWTWSESFARRYFERRQYDIEQRIKHLIMQNFEDPPDLPAMETVEEQLKKFPSRERIRKTPKRLLNQFHSVIRCNATKANED